MKKAVLLAVCIGSACMIGGCTAKTVTAPGNHSAGYDEYVILGEYKGITVDPVTVTEEDVDAEINRMLTSRAQISQVTDRAAAMGDTVSIDYEGTQNGEAFENGSYQDQLIELGSGNFIDGFEAGIEGMFPGESKDITVTFPQDYWDVSMAGTEAEFHITLNYIRQIDSIPEYTDSLVQELTGGDLTTTAEYTAWLRGQMELDAVNYRRSQLMNAIMASSQFKDLPQNRIEAMAKELNVYYTDVAQQQYGETLEEYAAAYGMSLEDFQNELAMQAEQNVQQDLVTLAISEKENILITDVECEERAKQYGYDGFSEMAGIYGEERARELLLMDKVRDTLLDA
ncbi:trigger factor [Clostridium sp. chh4-2]|uniref:trigger factor n=1 Tax=Clostridium sp. chh4-2 TaxID=2067550 RepID=UPI0015E16855|nr:trigger factor [Clostridium sp. chh4-2]